MLTILIIVAPMIAACIISFVLGTCWQARRDQHEINGIIERIESERAILHAECPWELS